ncbi:hypothetical protein HZA40_01410 [Candidatus Peregrinibacteria bacterium]|nr:hypothetical protein [Candidatus Peregrinibacteria bacterium]
MTTNNNKNTERETSADQQRMYDEIEKSGNPDTKEIADSFRKGKIEDDVLYEIRELVMDPNKMSKDPYKRFVKCLAKDKFPRKGKFALRFLTAMEDGGEKEQEYAAEMIRKLSDDASPKLTLKTEKDHLKKLNELREEDIENQTIEGTGTAAQVIMQSADTGESVRKSTEEIIGKNKNWKIEKLPQSKLKEFRGINQNRFKLHQESNQKDEELKKALGETPPSTELAAKLKKELETIDEKLKEQDKLEQEWLVYAKRAISQFKALKKFSGNAGLDMDAVSKLETWFLDANVPLDKGIKIDIKTGKTLKEKQSITIRKIEFRDRRNDEMVIEDDAAGTLMVEYEDENGNIVSETYLNFIGFLNCTEAHEDITSMDDLNDKIQDEALYKPLAAGQTYTAKKTGSAEEQEFTIENIEERDGKQVIVLDHTVTKIPRHKMPNSVSDFWYFDRKQQVFSLGEFARFVKQEGFKRKPEQGEDQEICDASARARTERNLKFVEGANEWQKQKFEEIGGAGEKAVKVPKDGEVSNVVFLDEYKRERKAKLRTGTDEKGEKFYEVEYNDYPFANDFASLTPAAFAISGGFKSARPKITKKRLNQRSFMESAQKGDIYNAKHTEGMLASSVSEANSKNQSATAPAHAIGDKEEEQIQHIPKHAYEGDHARGHKDEHNEKEGESKMGDSKKNGIYEEALPYDAIYKTGLPPHGEEIGFAKGLWIQTRVLSVDDLWQMGKAMYEYYIRRFERRQKEKYSKVAEHAPFFAPEMKRVHQAAENEQVNQFKESFEQLGVQEIRERLRHTHNRDELKAAIMVLTDKGMLRWDDIEFWQSLNRFVTNSHAKIPIPSNGDPYTHISPTDFRTGFDFLEEAVDSLWGTGVYGEWFAHNKSHFAQQAKSFYEEGKELEGVPGGHQRKLSLLLRQHKHGEFVDPIEYEGLLLHSIEAGKAVMEDKIYYMMEGVGAVNSKGDTILGFDRIAHINSEMLTRFPILEYICAKGVKRGPDGRSHNFTLEDYKQWVHFFDNGEVSNPERNKPSQAVNDFMWKYIIPSDETENRINKALRHAENIDHDDMFAYLPPANEQVITDSCKALSGSKKFLTVEGYANVIPGFSQYMKSLGENNNKKKLTEAFKSYVRFEGIMNERYEKGNDGYQRLSDASLDGATIVSDTHPREYIEQMNKMVRAVIASYGNDDLNKIATLIYDTHVGDIANPDEKKKQDKINYAYKQFGKAFSKVVESDGGQKMIDIVNAAALIGMPYIETDEKIRRKAAASSKSEE